MVRVREEPRKRARQGRGEDVEGRGCTDVPNGEVEEVLRRVEGSGGKEFFVGSGGV